MDNKDHFEREIKNIMEEETLGMTLSQETLDYIFQHRKKTFREKIGAFLNREVEIPLVPVIVGIAALLVITIVPKEALKIQSEEIINMNGSQVIIREGYEVGQNEDEN